MYLAEYIVNMPEGKDVIQSNVDRLREQAS